MGPARRRPCRGALRSVMWRCLRGSKVRCALRSNARATSSNRRSRRRRRRRRRRSWPMPRIARTPRRNSPQRTQGNNEARRRARFRLRPGRCVTADLTLPSARRSRRLPIATSCFLRSRRRSASSRARRGAERPHRSRSICSRTRRSTVNASPSSARSRDASRPLAWRSASPPSVASGVEPVPWAMRCEASPSRARRRRCSFARPVCCCACSRMTTH